MTQPRCAGQNCKKKLRCVEYHRPLGWLDQWNPVNCKKFKPIKKRVK